MGTVTVPVTPKLYLTRGEGFRLPIQCKHCEDAPCLNACTKNAISRIDGQVVIDESKGHVIGFWRQIADATRADGTRYEVAGIGGSWFIYGGDFQWRWQRDWFDFGNAAALFMEMMGDGTLSDGMTARMQRSMKPDLPGYYPLGGAPVGLWDRPS